MTISIILFVISIIIISYGILKFRKKSDKKEFAIFLSCAIVISIIGLALIPASDNQINLNNPSIDTSKKQEGLSNKIETTKLNLDSHIENFNLETLIKEVENTLDFEEKLYYDELFIQVKEDKLSVVEFKLSKNTEGPSFIKAMSKDDILTVSTSNSETIGFKGISLDDYLRIYSYGLDVFKDKEVLAYNVVMDNNAKVTMEDIDKGCYILSSDLNNKRQAKKKDEDKNDDSDGKYIYLYVDYTIKENGENKQIFERFYIRK